MRGRGERGRRGGRQTEGEGRGGERGETVAATKQ